MVRQAPIDHAKLYPLGSKKRGNDGNMWVITMTKGGIKRWRRHQPTRRHRARSRSRSKTRRIRRSRLGKKGTSYLVHDNGGRPFKVVISGKRVSIYEQPRGEDFAKPEGYTRLIKTYPHTKKIFVGKDKKLGKFADGNSVLVQLSANRYLYIGSWIYEFSTRHDHIVAYFSQVGNSDVPYPVALGEKNVYFMLQPTAGTRPLRVGKHKVSRRAGVVPRDAFPPGTDWEDAYTLFYESDETPPPRALAKKFYKVKLIQKRRW